MPWFTRNEIQELSVILLVLLIGGYGAVSVMLYVDEKTCMEKARLMNLTAKFSPFSECMVLQDGKWFPLNQIRRF